MTGHIGRREFIALLGSAVAAWPLAARAQQTGKTPRVGYIRAGTPHNDPFREEFVRGMRDLGYVEGRNIAYEFRHYGDDVESIPSLIGDLLRAKVDIIVVGGTAAIRAAQRATQSIPIVMGAVGRPVGKRLDRRSGAPGRQHNRALRHVHGTGGEAAGNTEAGHDQRRSDCNPPAADQSGAFLIHKRGRTDRRGARPHLSGFASARVGRFRAEFRVNAGVAGRCRLRAG